MPALWDKDRRNGWYLLTYSANDKEWLEWEDGHWLAGRTHPDGVPYGYKTEFHFEAKYFNIQGPFFKHQKNLIMQFENAAYGHQLFRDKTIGKKAKPSQTGLYHCVTHNNSMKRSVLWWENGAWYWIDKKTLYKGATVLGFDGPYTSSKATSLKDILPTKLGWYTFTFPDNSKMHFELRTNGYYDISGKLVGSFNDIVGIEQADAGWPNVDGDYLIESVNDIVGIEQADAGWPNVDDDYLIESGLVRRINGEWFYVSVTGQLTKFVPIWQPKSIVPQARFKNGKWYLVTLNDGSEKAFYRNKDAWWTATKNGHKATLIESLYKFKEIS